MPAPLVAVAVDATPVPGAAGAVPVVAIVVEPVDGVRAGARVRGTRTRGGGGEPPQLGTRTGLDEQVVVDLHLPASRTIENARGTRVDVVRSAPTRC